MAIEEEEEAGIPEWVVTFGDMMSLLLTFFIMLFSMSEVKQEEMYQAMLEALRKRFGHDASTISMIPGAIQPRNSALAKLASMGRARRAHTMKGGDKVKAPVGDHPRVMSFRQAERSGRGGLIVFKEGSAELTEAHKQMLRATALDVGGKPQKIEIRGHTSNRPLPAGSPHKTHWDLAYVRCRHVMEYLEQMGINPKRFRPSQAAQNEPKHLDDPVLRKENPRVEIYMLNELVKDLQGTVQEKPQEFSHPGAL